MADITKVIESTQMPLLKISTQISRWLKNATFMICNLENLASGDFVFGVICEKEGGRPLAIINRNIDFVGKNPYCRNFLYCHNFFIK